MLYLVCLIPVAQCATENVTIDDTVGGRFMYGPIDSPSPWNNGPHCTDCFAQPDPNQAFNQTWHDSTFNDGHAQPTAMVSFDGGCFDHDFLFKVTNILPGSAVYVMAILMTASKTPEDTGTQLTFFINNTESGNFSSNSQRASAGFFYNVTVFSKKDLPLGIHNLSIVNGFPNSGGNKSMLLLDRIIYS